MTPAALAKRYHDYQVELGRAAGIEAVDWEALPVAARQLCIDAAGVLLMDLEDRGYPNFEDEEPIHTWFELTYSQYLTVPRSLLQSMPKKWQGRFVGLLQQLDATFDWRPKEGRYWVRLKDAEGRFVPDPLMDYERGRRRVQRQEGAPS